MIPTRVGITIIHNSRIKEPAYEFDVAGSSEPIHGLSSYRGAVRLLVSFDLATEVFIYQHAITSSSGLIPKAGHRRANGCLSVPPDKFYHTAIGSVNVAVCGVSVSFHSMLHIPQALPYCVFRRNDLDADSLGLLMEAKK